MEESHGILSFPETVRFLAQVINDFDVPGGANSCKARNQMGIPDLIQVG